MISLVKSKNNYTLKYNDVTLISGGENRIIATGYWNYGISKEEMHKALLLLKNTKTEAIIFKDNKIIT